jgi:hypothetical protein
MSGFDIKTLLQFEPARYQCLKCLALLKETTIIDVLESRNRESFVCPSCNVEYIPTDTFGAYEIFDYLRYRNCYVHTQDIMRHGKQLALIAMDMPYQAPSNPPFRHLLMAMSRAKKFIHFSATGLNLLLLGVFKLLAQRVPICGVACSLDQAIVDDLEAFSDEAPTLCIKSYDALCKPELGHKQDLVIVDGLLAFRGHEGLSLLEWRKAIRAEDAIETITNIEEVINLNNNYFSFLWKQLSKSGEGIMMEREPLSLRMRGKDN